MTYFCKRSNKRLGYPPSKTRTFVLISTYRFPALPAIPGISILPCQIPCPFPSRPSLAYYSPVTVLCSPSFIRSAENSKKGTLIPNPALPSSLVARYVSLITDYSFFTISKKSAQNSLRYSLLVTRTLSTTGDSSIIHQKSSIPAFVSISLRIKRIPPPIFAVRSGNLDENTPRYGGHSFPIRFFPKTSTFLPTQPFNRSAIRLFDQSPACLSLVFSKGTLPQPVPIPLLSRPPTTIRL
jgi:hypothetical protein